jgi:hypothetical protein
MHSLAEIINFNLEHPELCLPPSMMPTQNTLFKLTSTSMPRSKRSHGRSSIPNQTRRNQRRPPTPPTRRRPRRSRLPFRLVTTRRNHRPRRRLPLLHRRRSRLPDRRLPPLRPHLDRTPNIPSSISSPPTKTYFLHALCLYHCHLCPCKTRIQSQCPINPSSTSSCMNGIRAALAARPMRWPIGSMRGGERAGMN